MRFLLIIGLVFLFSCEGKEGPTVVEGFVKDINDNIIPNHPIKLESNLRRFSDMGGYDKNAVLTTMSNENGEYNFSFEANKDYYYQVLAVETNCYIEKEAEINEAASNKIDLKLGLKGVIKLKINSLLIGDSIYYQFYNQNGGYLYSTHYTITEYHTSKIALILDVGVNQNTILAWDLYTKNEGKIHKSMSLKPNQCDTLTYEIIK